MLALALWMRYGWLLYGWLLTRRVQDRGDVLKPLGHAAAVRQRHGAKHACNNLVWWWKQAGAQLPSTHSLYLLYDKEFTKRDSEATGKTRGSKVKQLAGSKTAARGPPSAVIRKESEPLRDALASTRTISLLRSLIYP
jgi:hypothetical protein